MHLIVGLGNPGEKYKNTRHNVGFMAVDAFVQQSAMSNWQSAKRAQTEIIKWKQGEHLFVAMKPQTFMNNSGYAVQRILADCRLPIANVIVLHDDIDLAFGTIRVSHNSSSGGHKGVQSIIDHLGRKAFWRIRIGIKSKIPDTRYQILKTIETPEFVLKPFSREEKKLLPAILKRVASLLKEMTQSTPKVQTVHI